MTPAELSRAVLTTVRRAVAAQELDVVVPEKIVVQRPPRPGCGDYATTVALQLAGPAGRTPLEVAAILSRRLAKEPGIAQVEIAGPGFLNITLDARAYGDVVRQVRAQGGQYGYGDGLADEPVTVAADRDDVRERVVAEAVNRLARAAGAPAGPPERLTVAPAPAPETTLGPDETRWALLRPPAEDTPRLTADLLAQRESNPLFRVRYAHARTRALLRNAHDLGVDPEAPASREAPRNPAHRAVPDARNNSSAPANPGPRKNPAPSENADPCYHHPAETELLGLIADFPRVIETAARRRAPDRLARHLERLADAFFRFHDECPPLPKGEEKPSAVHAARLRLADATGVVLAGGLHLLGITAPDHL
ncbi:ArgS-related anticodon-binding protein NrtL [Streptomyces sp.]|uniref:ArgS-related anticodon-binding protein NrtL n=1 Tax=Streptomyces sp. TaxID=1931 RepID=UPI002F3F4470